MMWIPPWGTVLGGDGFQQNIWTFPVGITS